MIEDGMVIEDSTTTHLTSILGSTNVKVMRYDGDSPWLSTDS